MDDLEKEKANLKDNVERLEKEKAELIMKVSEIENLNNDLTNKLANFEANVENLTETNSKLNQDLQETITSSTQKVEGLETELKTFANLRLRIEQALGCAQNDEEAIFDSIERFKQTITDKSKEISDLTKQLNEAKAEIAKIRKYEQILTDIKTNSEKFKDQPWGNENLALVFNGLIPENELEFMIPQGENISMQEENDWLIKGDINKFSNELQIQSTFCMIGGSQTGKTFLLSKLSGFEFGFGKKFPTECLKFKKVVIQGVNLLSIDTPGIHKPAKFSGVNFEIEELQDLFMSHVVTGLSNTIIFIINNFNIHEQKLLVQFSKQAKYKKKKFVIVHNFKEVYDKEELEEAWKKTSC